MHGEAVGAQDNAKISRKTHYSVHTDFLTLDISDLNVTSYCKHKTVLPECS